MLRSTAPAPEPSPVAAAQLWARGKNGMCSKNLPVSHLPLTKVRKPVNGVSWYAFSADWNFSIIPSLFCTPKDVMACNAVEP